MQDQYAVFHPFLAMFVEYIHTPAQISRGRRSPSPLKLFKLESPGRSPRFHRKFQSVALVKNYCSRNSMVAMVTMTFPVLWKDLNWQMFPEWTGLCSDRSCSLGRDEGLVICGRMWPWEPPSSWQERMDMFCFVTRCVRERQHCPLLTSSVLLDLSSLNRPQRSPVSPQLWLGPLTDNRGRSWAKDNELWLLELAL